MMTSHQKKELNRQAFLEGINKETAGEWMNLARRLERIGRLEDAANAKFKAESIRKRFPHFLVS